MDRDREKRVAHLKDPELQKSILRLLDLSEKSSRQESVEVSGFLDPYTLETARGILRDSDAFHSTDGGYRSAERARLAFFPEGKDAIDFRLSYIRVSGNFHFRHVSHRDYLGSLLALGLNRDKIGDILVMEDGCQVVLDSEIADFVRYNWMKVNQVSVRAAAMDREDLLLPDISAKEIRSTVASLRLDAVLGLGFGESRSKVVPDIKGGRVRINWKTITDPSFHLNAGDRIACQGKGRLRLKEISGPSQKGRLFVTILRFL